MLNSMTVRSFSAAGFLAFAIAAYVMIGPNESSIPSKRHRNAEGVSLFAV